jgi:tetratricopeptide (TPR) repeat protein
MDQKRANELVGRGNSFHRAKKYEQAIAAYEEAIKLFPAYGSFKLVIGDMLLDLRRYEEAAQAYRETLEFVPDHDQARVSLKQCMKILEQRMSVSAYLLIPDPDIYHGILARNADDWDVFDQFVGKPIGDAWIPIPVRFEKSQQRGDFPSLVSHIPVFSERALHVLKPLVADNIEVLPLECQEEPLYAINVLDLVDCLDYSRSKVRRFPSGGIMFIEKYAFKEGSIDGHHLFKVEEAPLKGVLASNRLKSLVEQNGLLGLVFKPVG